MAFEGGRAPHGAHKMSRRELSVATESIGRAQDARLTCSTVGENLTLIALPRASHIASEAQRSSVIRLQSRQLGRCPMRLFALSSLSAILLAGVALAGPPTGAPGASVAANPGRPDFAGSGKPEFAGPSNGIGSTVSSNASGSARGNASNAGSFPSNSNAGGQGLTHASTNAQGTLEAINNAFSDGEVSLIREYFTERAHGKKPTDAAASSTYRRGQKLADASLAEPLPADLLAQLPNRPGLTYVRIGSDVLLLAGPNDVIVDIIPNAS